MKKRTGLQRKMGLHKTIYLKTYDEMSFTSLLYLLLLLKQITEVAQDEWTCERRRTEKHTSIIE